MSKHYRPGVWGHSGGRITIRDEQLILALESTGYLTLQQIQSLFFDGLSYQMVQRRLKQLSAVDNRHAALRPVAPIDGPPVCTR